MLGGIGGGEGPQGTKDVLLPGGGNPGGRGRKPPVGGPVGPVEGGGLPEGGCVEEGEVE